MGLSDQDINRIVDMIRNEQMASEVVYGQVVRRDVSRKLIWMKEFGDQPIPLVAMNGTVKVPDTTAGGVVMKTVNVKYEVPKIGQTVVVLRQFGSRRLPKCVGVIITPGGFQAV
jgi:hypothetical protein